jgi:hypothetical protein
MSAPIPSYVFWGTVKERIYSAANKWKCHIVIVTHSMQHLQSERGERRYKRTKERSIRDGQKRTVRFCWVRDRSIFYPKQSETAALSSGPTKATPQESTTPTPISSTTPGGYTRYPLVENWDWRVPRPAAISFRRRVDNERRGRSPSCVNVISARLKGN